MQLPSTGQAWVIPAGIGAFVAWRVVAAGVARKRATERLFGAAAPVQREPSRRTPSGLWGSWLEVWLFLSGFRGAGAVQRFLVAEGAAVVLGMTISLIVARSGVVELGVEWLREIPGGIGDFFAPLLSIAPYILFVLFAFLPIARVRARRRLIVQTVEQDLPMALALLATLVESGLGFDAAVERILVSLDPDRPLARELELFRSESRAGVPRLTCFRSLAKRLDIPAVSTFVSAMVHSEHVGGGVTESLRRQADEVWSRRRELAIQRAQTLPTKLAIPLVLCFLPGIFVHTLGPAIAEFLRIADSVVPGAQ